jgi:hypothetical protein
MYNRKDDSRQSTTTNSTEPCCGVCVAAGRPNTRHLECNCFWKFPELRRNRRDNRRDTKSAQSNSNQKMRDIKQAEMDIQSAQAKLVALTSNNYNTSSSPADSDHNAWFVSRVSAVVKTKSFNSTDSIDFNLDTGTTDHCIMSQEAHKLTNVNVNHIEDFVQADDTKVQSKGAGYLSQLGNDLVHIQDFGDNLLAPKKLFDKGIATIISPKHGIILARDDQIEVKVKQALAYGSVVANQFRVSLSTVHPTVNLVSSLFEREPAPTPAMSKGLSREDGIKLAFARSGYQNPSRLITAVKQNLVTGLNLPTDINSEDFHFIGNHNGYQIAKARAKQHRKRKGGRNKPTSPFEKIYFDLAVPNINSYRKDTCAIVIVCAFSGWKVFIPLKHRSEVAEKLRDWHQQWVILNNFHINIV